MIPKSCQSSVSLISKKTTNEQQRRRGLTVLKILETNMKKRFVKVIPESVDDLWHLYNIICRNDEVYAHTTREMKPDEKYARPGRGERISVFLGVKVETVGLDKLLNRLRVQGTICAAPENVPMGAHHAISIAVNTSTTIVKKEWTKHHLERLKRARETSEKPIIIVSIDDESYAIATTAQYGIEERVEERIKLPGKLEHEKRSAAVNEYFRKVVDSLRQIWATTRNPVGGIGGGFGKGEFTIVYGFEEVERATKLGAVEKLMLADSLLRESSDEKRLAIEEVMKEAEKKRGSVMVISTGHEAGAKLVALSGIAALLRFPISQNADGK